MGGNTLKNRSSRFGEGASPGRSGNDHTNGEVADRVPVRTPHDGSVQNYRTAYSPSNGGERGDDNHTVKSNSGLLYNHHQQPWYMLPCFRFRSKNSALMAMIATAAIFLSVCSVFFIYRSVSSMPLSSPDDLFLLPTAREWGKGRAHRIQARQQRRRVTPKAETQIKSYSEYETILLNYLFTIRAEGAKSQILPLSNVEQLGQDMSHYANLGCSVFHQIANNQKQNKIDPREMMQQLWSSHLSTILAASQHPDDANYAHRSWTTTLLKSLSPYSMLDHIPDNDSNLSDRSMNAKDIERIIGILVKRFLGLLQNKGRATAHATGMPPPLRIAVFGGPTVEGMGCHRARVGIPAGSIMSYPTFCAFPYRLEQFLNAILLPPNVLKQLRRTLSGLGPDAPLPNEAFRLVEVINLGEEGTNSEFSAAIVRNRIYPPPSNVDTSSSSTGYGGGPPDVVIDAYGIDDHGKESAEFDSFFDIVNHPYSDLQMQCPRDYPKPRPVIIRAVLEDEDSASEFASSIMSAVMGDTSSIMTAVVGDAIDDVEEGEMSLPDVQNPENNETESGGAFGMAGHIATSWVLAFNLAHAAISHCGSTGYHPNRVPQKRFMSAPASSQCDNGIDPPCIFSFLAGPKGTATRPSAIASNLMPYMVENSGWQAGSDMSAGFARKMGLVASGEGATLTLLFRNITRPVRRFDVITLRSTAQAWKDGAVQFVLVTGGDFSHGSQTAEKSADSARETTFEVSAGLEVDNLAPGEDRHISYHFGLDLDEGDGTAQLGTDVLLRMILTKGSRFKVLGLMLCE